MSKKTWRVTSDYEPNRLVSSTKADTYEKILPKSKYKINLDKNAVEKDIYFQHFLKNQQQKSAK